MDLPTFLLAVAAALVFAFIRWLLAPRTTNIFLVDFLSFGAALLVLLTHSLLGLKL